MQIERTYEAGRRAEVHTVEQTVDGATQRTTEHYEEIVPLQRRKRIVEKIVPVVVERLTEQYDGNQIHTTTEQVQTCLNVIPTRPSFPLPSFALPTINVLVNYGLFFALAVVVGVTVWQLFIR